MKTAKCDRKDACPLFWDIYQDMDWPTEFFGGDAVLSIKIVSSDDAITILSQKDYKFRISGENPDPIRCRAFIDSHNGGYSYMYAIAKHETSGEGSPNIDGEEAIYNHFLTLGSKSNLTSIHGREGIPNWNNDSTNKKMGNVDTGRRVNNRRILSWEKTGRWTGSGGYGLLQLTYESRNNQYDTAEASYIMPRDWIWNWQSNLAPAVAKLVSKETIATRLYNWLSVHVDSSIQTQTCPTSGSSQGVFSAYQGILIAMYNGNAGFTQVPPHGTSTRSSPWKYENGSWIFTGEYTIKVANKL